ncbi:MAG: alpha/beta fold hydrolase [Altibacter sp.]|uniref:alpha/beta fold hydrolase n=1 Tax=Altibacter sp. TaxID=2024823 RepID=UPI001D7900CF|nr:alpha/beta fold hydrolase [Altibacter sp.]MBZ0327380.1 alpha/beta fold hydrolase [Altibacter sp.]
MLLHSQIIGTGTPFVILHGFLGMGDNWKTLGNQFAEQDYEVHLIDQRNHGRSFHSDDFSYDFLVKDLKAYCDHYKLNEIVLLGHSMGGKVAMLFAVSYPELVSKLLVADIAPKAYPPHHQDILKALTMLNFSEIDSRGEADTVLSAYIKDMGTRQFLLKNLYWKQRGELGLRMNLPVLSETIEEIGKPLPEGSFFLKDTLFLRGERSGYIEDMDELLIRKHFPKSKIRTISKAGHWLHAENPADFYRYVKDFL